MRKTLSLALAMLLAMVSLALPATTTTPVTLSTTAYTDLGAGPIALGSANSQILYQIADTQPAASAPGNVQEPGDPPAWIATSSHVWAIGSAAGARALVTAGTGLAGVSSANSGTFANPSSTLTLPATTTAYAAGQLIASSATAGSVVVPFLTLLQPGTAIIPRLRLSTNDATSTAWPAVSLQVDLWAAAPTFTNGDRGAFLVATGAANHLGAFSCTMSAEYGDGAYAECAPTVGSVSVPKLASGLSVFWTLQASSASGVTGASKVFTLTAETLQ